MTILTDYEKDLDSISNNSNISKQQMQTSMQQKDSSVNLTKLSPDESLRLQEEFRIKDNSNAFWDGIDSFNSYMGVATSVPFHIAKKLKLTTPEFADKVSSYTKEQLETIRKAEIGSPVASTIGGVAAGLGLTAPIAVGGLGAGLATKVGSYALQGAKMGGMLGLTSPENFTPEGELDVGKTLENTAGSAAIGAVINPAIPVAGAALKGIGKGIKTVAGKVSPSAWLPSMKATQEALEKFGIEGTTVGDISGSKVVDVVENQLRGAIGLGRPLQKAEEALQKSLPNSVRILGNLVAKDAKGDVAGLNQQLTKALNGARQYDEMLWKQVDDLSQNVGQKVDLTPLFGISKEVADSLTGIGMSRNFLSMADKLRKIAPRTESGEHLASFAQVRKFRTALNTEIGQAIKSSNVTADELMGLQAMKQSLDTQIDQWGSRLGKNELLDAYNKAKGFHSQFKKFVQDDKLHAKVLDAAGVEDFANRLLRTKNFERLRQQTEFLNKYGNVQSELIYNKINNLLAKSIKPTGEIDPVAFSSLLQRDSMLKELLGSSREAQILQEYSKLLNKLHRPVGQIGSQIASFVTIGASLGIAGLPGLIGAYSLSRIFASPKILTTLKFANQLPPNTNPTFMSKIVNQINDMLQRATVVYALKKRQMDEQEYNKDL